MLAGAAALLLLSTGGSVRAAEGEGPAEPLIVIGQGLAGVGTSVAMLYGGAVLGEAPLLVAMVLTPLASASAVCLVGSISDHYRGSCTGPVVFAYAAGLLIVPVLLLVSDDIKVDGSDQKTWVSLALGVTWFILPTVSATFAWHSFKRPIPRGLSLRRPAFPPERPRGLVRSPGEVTVPVLSFTF